LTDERNSATSCSSIPTELMNGMLRLAVLMLGTVGAFAQGIVQFNNNVLTAPPDRTVYYGNASTPATGTNLVAQLYWSTDNGVTLTAVTAAPARFRPAGTTPAGTWLGGNRTLPNGVGGIGTTIQLQVRAWDVLHPEYGEGRSAIFDYTQTLSSPPSATDTWIKNFVGGWVIPVPEPSSIGLGVIGIGALFLLRRRK
jgi:hypothetical protein